MRMVVGEMRFDAKLFWSCCLLGFQIYDGVVLEPGVQVSGFVGLSPSLSTVCELFSSPKLTVVRSVHRLCLGL